MLQYRWLPRGPSGAFGPLFWLTLGRFSVSFNYLSYFLRIVLPPKRELKKHGPNVTEMAQTPTKKELASIFAPAILSLLFAITTYISYTWEWTPECSQSVNAGQCWDFRPLLSHVFSFLTLILTIFSLILTFFSVHRYRLRKGIL